MSSEKKNNEKYQPCYVVVPEVRARLNVSPVSTTKYEQSEFHITNTDAS